MGTGMLPPSLIHIFYYLVTVVVQNPDNVPLEILDVVIRSPIPLQPQQASRIIVERGRLIIAALLRIRLGVYVPILL